jgi:hypothetical protein
MAFTKILIGLYMAANKEYEEILERKGNMLSF